MKDHKGMRPQDVLILLKLISIEKQQLAFPQNKDLATSLHISPAEISASLHRSSYAGLYDMEEKKVFKTPILEFLRYGLKYAFPIQPGAIVRGIATAHSAEPLKSSLSFQEEIVWDYSLGNVRGQSVLPLYPSVPVAVSSDILLYELLCANRFDQDRRRKRK